MRTRKTIAILGVGLILACCVMIYLMMDLTLFPPGQDSKLSVNDVSYNSTAFNMLALNQVYTRFVANCKNFLILLESMAPFRKQTRKIRKGFRQTS